LAFDLCLSFHLYFTYFLYLLYLRHQEVHSSLRLFLAYHLWLTWHLFLSSHHPFLKLKFLYPVALLIWHFIAMFS